MTTQELQASIKWVIRELGWGVAKAGRRIYCELNDTDNEDEIRRFIENFKKHISRKTTPPEKLKLYLNALREIEEVNDLEIVFPSYVPSGHLDQSLQRRLEETSQKLNRDYRENDYSEG